jgi:hypothetical protein
VLAPAGVTTYQRHRNRSFEQTEAICKLFQIDHICIYADGKVKAQTRTTALMSRMLTATLMDVLPTGSHVDLVPSSLFTNPPLLVWFQCIGVRYPSRENDYRNEQENRETPQTGTIK